MELFETTTPDADCGTVAVAEWGDKKHRLTVSAVWFVALSVYRCLEGTRWSDSEKH